MNRCLMCQIDDQADATVLVEITYDRGYGFTYHLCIPHADQVVTVFDRRKASVVVESNRATPGETNDEHVPDRESG